jgi:hypothetical protein
MKQSWDMWARRVSGLQGRLSCKFRGQTPTVESGWFRVRVVAWDDSWPAQEDVPHRGEKVRHEGTECVMQTGVFTGFDGIDSRRAYIGIQRVSDGLGYSIDMSRLERIPPEEDERRELAAWAREVTGRSMGDFEEKMRRIAKLLERG